MLVWLLKLCLIWSWNKILLICSFRPKILEPRRRIGAEPTPGTRVGIKKPAQKKPQKPIKPNLKNPLVSRLFGVLLFVFSSDYCFFFTLIMINSSRNKVHYHLYWFLGVHSTKIDTFIHFLRLKPMIVIKEKLFE